MKNERFQKWLVRLRIFLRVAGVLGSLSFLLVASLALRIRWWDRQSRDKAPEPAAFTHILNHAEVAKATQIKRVVHFEKQGANQFVELETAPFSEETLRPSAIDKTFEQGWFSYSKLDPTIASLVRMAAKYARQQKLDWFPDADAIASGRFHINLWSGALRHGKMERAHLILCDPAAGQVFSAEIRVPKKQK